MRWVITDMSPVRSRQTAHSRLPAVDGVITTAPQAYFLGCIYIFRDMARAFRLVYTAAFVSIHVEHLRRRGSLSGMHANAQCYVEHLISRYGLLRWCSFSSRTGRLDLRNLVIDIFGGDSGRRGLG